MRSNSRAVCGPIVCAQCTIREGVHSRCAWWERGRCSAIVTACPWPARPQVRSHALTLVEDLDGRWRRAYFHQLLHQVVRHAVVVRVEGDVIVDVDSGTRPIAQVETLGG